MVSTKLIRSPWTESLEQLTLHPLCELSFNCSINQTESSKYHFTETMFYFTFRSGDNKQFVLNFGRFRIEENPSASVHPAPADPRQAWRSPWSRYTATVWNIILFTSFTLIRVYIPGLNLLSKLFRLVDKVTIVVVGHNDSLDSRGVTDNPPVVVTIPAFPLCSPVWGEGQNAPLGQFIHDPPLFCVAFLVSWQRQNNDDITKTLVTKPLVGDLQSSN